MTATKAYYDQMLENQQKLFSAMSEYTSAMMEMAMPAKDTASEASELLNEYYAKTTEMMEAMASKAHIEAYQKDFWATFMADYSHSAQLSMDLYKKAAEHFKAWMSANPMEMQQERSKKLTELYQHSAKALYETAQANTKVVQEYFSAN